ncbi:MAG: TIGR03364 family FAD-dependent oxidoreductase [Caulobacteraceae bacterium]|nr:MAG: TIGR03364 family FAD-dependent oxidoreductase [Caulobacteraceae bacterium]
MIPRYEVAVVGMGIIGLAHAYAAARAGLKVVVIDREPAARGASIRNFGFVTVTGQARGDMWGLARRARDVWAEVAPAAGIAVDQTGLTVLAHRPEAQGVLEAFMATEMAEGCELVSSEALAARMDCTGLAPFRAALASKHELRVEPRLALPALAAWLEAHWGVEFMGSTTVLGCESGRLSTSRGEVAAEAIFLCTGDDLNGLFPDVLARHAVQRCKLQMLRLASPGRRLATPIMADLSLARYEGYAALPEAEALLRRLREERGDLLDLGVHLIAVQSADGSLVVGDSHEYDAAPDPFQRREIDDLILKALRESMPGYDTPAVERWIGVYAWSPQHPWFTEEVAPGVHMTVVTCGAGMSTGFAIGERVVSAATNLSVKGAA